MSQAGIDAMVERYLDDPDFADEFARNPEAAVRRAGFELSDDEIDALRAAEGVRLGEALRARVSRAAFGLGG